MKTKELIERRKEMYEFIKNYITVNRKISVDVMSLHFMRQFCEKFPTKSKHMETYVRGHLNTLAENGYLKKQYYSFGSGKYDHMGNSLPIGCNVYMDNNCE